MPSLLVDVVNGISAIHHEIQSILLSNSEEFQNIHSEDWSENLLTKIFGDHRRVCDGILTFYLGQHQNPDLQASAREISCLFTALCLCDSDDFVRFLFDIAEPTNERYISMANLGLLLRMIFESVGGKKVEEESLNSMSLYASVVANRIDEGMYTQDGTIFIQKKIPTQYYTRKHKHGLWPLEVLQHQIKEKFLGTEFWERIRQSDLKSLDLSSSRAPCFQNYLETIISILKDAPEVKKKQFSVNNLSDLSGDPGPHSQVIEDHGVYTLKTSAPSGIQTSSFLRRPVNRKPSLRVTDPDETLPGIDCPFVSESDVALLKHPRSPSPEPSTRSNHSSRPPSRQNSPLSSKSSSFSFDVVDMGESPMSNQNSGIATGRGSQPVTPSNLLRNRPNQKLPGRLTTGALPPLSNHSSRSTSPLLMNTSPANSTHSSSENVPLDNCSGSGEGGGGGLSDIVLEATYLMKGLKILIIEDSTFQRKLMTKKLHSTGRRPSGLDRKGSFDQMMDASVTPKAGGVFNFSDIVLTTTPSPAAVTAANDLPQSSSLVNDPIGEFPSASQSPADVGQEDQSPASILHSNQSNDISLTPTAGKENLEEDGWHVSEAVNGEEAIQRLITTKETFDIIFVDENLQSSGGNLLGHEVVRILRGHHSVPSSTIIIGCSSTAEQNALLFLEAGANAVWSKPMPSDEKIRNEICKYLAAV